MYVKSIHLKDYRNFEKLQVDLNDQLNVFIGDNAQGKTNLLESIFVSAIGKSFRFSKDSGLIRWDCERSHICVEYIKTDGEKIIDIILDKNNQKMIKTNGLTLEKNSDLVGLTNVVVFSPDSIDLVKGSPSERRKYMNVELSQLKPNYKYILKKYSKIVLQRNHLLKKMSDNGIDNRLLAVWNDHLVAAGTDLIWYRLDYIKKIVCFSQKIHDTIAGGVEKLDIRYKSSLGKINDFGKEEIKRVFKEKIEKGLERELFRKSSLYGPHLDDLDIMINGMDIKYYASQGQKRTAALSLVLAEIEVIYEEKGEYPVLLLDDVMSELDHHRKHCLMTFTKKVQTIITSTDDSDLKSIIKEQNKKIFYLQKGVITEIIE